MFFRYSSFWGDISGSLNVVLKVNTSNDAIASCYARLMPLDIRDGGDGPKTRLVA